MTKKISGIFVLTVLAISVCSIYSCSKDKQATGTDKELYNLATVSSGFTWFKNSSVQLNKSAGSGHSQPFLRTRYNTLAATMLDTNGKIVTAATFPEGSLVVKELYDNATSLGRYAMLYKNSSSADADANGWVWGYVNADGTVAEAASEKGSACISCHSQADNIDYMLMNKYFP